MAVVVRGETPTGEQNFTNPQINFKCTDEDQTAASILISLGSLGIGANLALMAVIVFRRPIKRIHFPHRWSQGLLFHQAMVDCARAAILMPLGTSILYCKPVNKCSLVETAFLLLVTVSTVNLLTTVLNDAPVLPDDDDDDAIPMLMDSPECVTFGIVMIWFASITINLGPTFLSGALAANSESYLNKPSCPLIQGPFRHYVLNVLWIFINVLCVLLTMYHLYKLYKDLSRSNLEAVRVASLVTTMISVNQSPSSLPDGSLIPGLGPTQLGAPGASGLGDHNSHQILPQQTCQLSGSQMSLGGGGGAGQARNGRAHTESQPAQPPNGNAGHHQGGVVGGGGLTESARIKAYIARLERDGIARVKMFIVITIAYLIFWGPLFLVTLFSYGDYKTETPSTSHEVTLHVAFVHAFVNPTLFLVLHKGLRKATVDLLCCNFRSSDSSRGGAAEDGVCGDSILGGSRRRGSGSRGVNDDLMIDSHLPPPPPLHMLNNGGTGRSGTLEIDSLHPRAYMLTETRSDTGSKKETTL